MTGIYCIKNLKTNMIYIGQSVNVKNRMLEHFKKMKNGTHDNNLMKIDFEKYGQESFICGMIKECTVDELDRLEIFYINKFNSYKIGYNGVMPIINNLRYKIKEGQYNGRIKVYYKNTSEFLCTFEKIEYCANVMKIKSASINACLEFKRESHRNYIFTKEDSSIEKWKNEWVEITKNKKTFKESQKIKGKIGAKARVDKLRESKKYALYQLDMNENIIHDYDIISDIPEAFKKNKVRKCLQGEKKSYMGFKWRYKSNHV